jgi:hypothetical protein
LRVKRLFFRQETLSSALPMLTPPLISARCVPAMPESGVFSGRSTPPWTPTYPTSKEKARTPCPCTSNPTAKLSAQDFKGSCVTTLKVPLRHATRYRAGPYKVPYRWRPMTFTVDSVEYVNERATATQQTGFSLSPTAELAPRPGVVSSGWRGRCQHLGVRTHVLRHH